MTKNSNQFIVIQPETQSFEVVKLYIAQPVYEDLAKLISAETITPFVLSYSYSVGGIYIGVDRLAMDRAIQPGFSLPSYRQPLCGPLVVFGLDENLNVEGLSDERLEDLLVVLPKQAQWWTAEMIAEFYQHYASERE